MSCQLIIIHVDLTDLDRRLPLKAQRHFRNDAKVDEELHVGILACLKVDQAYQGLPLSSQLQVGCAAVALGVLANK